MTQTETSREKRTILLAQLFISCQMACLMTFLFSVLPHGLGPGWPVLWMRNFLTAWPVAFILSLGVGPVGFRLAFLLMHRRDRG